MALKSGLPDMVPWALNALALSSFSARPELPALPSLPGLLPALVQVLSAYPNSLLIYLSSKEARSLLNILRCHLAVKAAYLLFSLESCPSQDHSGLWFPTSDHHEDTCTHITIHNFLPSGSITTNRGQQACLEGM